VRLKDAIPRRDLAKDCTHSCAKHRNLRKIRAGRGQASELMQELKNFSIYTTHQCIKVGAIMLGPLDCSDPEKMKLFYHLGGVSHVD
jgi:hypothetical protein